MVALRRILVAAPVAALALSACNAINTIERGAEPVVLTGAQLPDLVGAAPGQVVAFRAEYVDSTWRWAQIPVQIDERRLVAFGPEPANNTTAGVSGSVYGTAATGPTSLQYADPGTFVGADPVATFDADDELVVLATDAGGERPGTEPALPAGVVPGSGVEVQLDDPLGDDDQAWVYLFRAAAGSGLDPAAGRDDVDYDFTLTSGAYKTTYKRADGPNAETSVVRTDGYEVRMRDRWIEDDWRIVEGGATGVDVLDGSKAQFAFGVCGRSNITFSDAEGAFVANIDGPLRAIRSYVGANSGPLTQRTHVYYGDRQVMVTDLRVHPIPAVMDFIDLSAAATGMTYRNSVHPGGVVVDGVPDAISATPATWELWSGAQGSVLSTSRLTTTAAVEPLQQVYVDDSTPPDTECWGDGDYLGAGGQLVAPAGGIPNTDPRANPAAPFRTTRTIRYAEPGVSAATAARWASWVDAPLAVTVTDYDPAAPASP